MRLIIDLQGAQTESRFRGIGRYTMSLVQEMVSQRGDHEVVLILNGLLSHSIDDIKSVFYKSLPMESIKVFQLAGPVMGIDKSNDARRKAAELMYEAFLASLEPDIVLFSSIIEYEAVSSIGNFCRSFPTAAILYDLIPLIYSERYLQDSNTKVWYFDRIDQLRRADILLSISESSRHEAFDYLSFKNSSVINISAAPDAGFQPVLISDTNRGYLKRKYGVSGEFLMYAGDIDWRKDILGLLNAFHNLPDSISSNIVFVFVGRSIEKFKDNFIEYAKNIGLTEDKLFFTGYVSEDDLVLLYNACTLFVFPSLHEGFGLPVLEAMCCGKAVVAANSSSLPEVLGCTEALFTPGDNSCLTSKIAEVLGNPAFRERLERHNLAQAKKFSWVTSAQRAWSALEHLHIQHASANLAIESRYARRPRLAFVSPLPPSKTGIADYSAELLPELARHYDITVIVQQEGVNDTWIKTTASVHDAAWLRQNAHCFDRVLYQMGNSDQHIHMFTLMSDVPGILVLHDFFLSGPLAWCMEGRPEHLHAWTKALYLSHGWKAVVDRFLPDHVAQAVMDWPCNLPMLKQALGVIVHSEFSRRLGCQFYGEQASKDWTLVPHLRQPVPPQDKATARKNLGLEIHDFVICSFGVLGETKLNQRLLDGWMASPLADQSHCHLIFVGENQAGEYGQVLLQRIAKCNAIDRIRITGWASTETYQDWLAATDIAVQLRTMSRGESSGTVLDCMNYGLPLIVNAHGSLAELPTDTVWLLPDVFEDGQLTEAITTLYNDQTRRKQLGGKALLYIRSRHSPRFCADQYFEAIEKTYAQANVNLYGLNQVLPQLSPPLPLIECVRLASVLADNFPPQPRLRQLLLDVSAIVNIDLKSGIERVTGSILKQLVMDPPSGWVVQAVYANTEQLGYRYARKFMCQFLNIPSDWTEDTPVQVWQDDIFLGLDFQPHVVSAQESIFGVWRNRGVSVYFVVYDLLPVLMPEVFPEGAKQGHQQWLQIVNRMDGALCISRTVANEFYDWLQVFGDPRKRPFSVYWFHLGTDADSSNTSSDLPNDDPQTLRSLSARPSFLMVGTIEPRKGVLQTLQAFIQLWGRGIDCNLVIVGKEGWKSVSEQLRGEIPQTVQALRTNPELGKRLFWLQGISDEYLEQIYVASTCLIAASYGEGFGLPLIEAAHYGLPLLLRDIPVFREVSAGQAQFFANTRQPEVISDAVSHWLACYQKGQHMHSNAMPHLTWEQSARYALDCVLGNSTPYRIWTPDGVRRYWGADPRLHYEVGRCEGRSCYTTSQSGYLFYGPYERFDAGSYRLIIRYTAKNLSGGEVFDIMTDSGNTTILYHSYKEMRVGELKDVFTFSLLESQQIEFRMFVLASTELRIDSLEINIISKDTLEIPSC